MNAQSETRAIQRYVALDLHKEYVMVGAMNAAQEWALRPRKVEMSRFRSWAASNLQSGDAVVLETTTNVWDIYDIVAPLVTRVVVAHAGAVRQIAEARVKTDGEDIKRLLRLLIADIVPEVWVPPAHVRELRGLISYRNRLIKTSTMARNRLQSLIHRHNLQLPKGELTNAAWWESQPLNGLEKMQVRQELALLNQVEQSKAELETELAKMSLGKTWGKSAAHLLQLPGLGLIVTMTVLAAIGDIRRFESPKCLVGYAGLGAGIHQSGKEHKDKGITKSGRKELRWALIEAAWRAVRSSPLWEGRFRELAKRRGERKAIVAIARKLLVTIWYVLTREQTDRHATKEDLAYKMLVLAWELNENARLGLTYKQFAKYALMKLGIETDITRFVRKNVPRRVASNAETLARMEELGIVL
ncbi:MAG: IS110 family transposase [Chloroflexota bacterium]|nr:IS110 family transposase [Chloroflexota bacterium]MBI5701909.1 IS110 family transposase [Chloroflexota bacterium]